MPLSFNVPDSLLSTTLANYQRTLQENIFRANPLIYYLVGKNPEVAGQTINTRGQMKVVDGGESIVVPLLYEKNSTAKSYSKYGLIDTTPQEGITAARYTWKQVAATITISGLEVRQNSGGERVIDLLQAKAMQAEMSIKEAINRMFASNGSDSSLDLSGLQAICSTSVIYGGINPAAPNAWWQAKVNSAGGSFAAGGVDAMRTKYNDVTRGSDKCDFIITDQATFERYEKVLQPQERFNDTDLADAGFDNLLFKGAPVAFDTYIGDLSAGNMYFLNSKYLNLFVHKDANFATTDFVTPQDQDAKTAKILFMGELTCSNRRFQGAILGFTA